MRPILIAGTLALILSLVGTPVVIRFFRQRGFGQMIREDGPAHQMKAGTPTMGGTAILLSALIAYVVARSFTGGFTPTGLLVMFTFIGMGAVGFLDDLIKLRMKRNLGLNKTAKFLGQASVAAVVGYIGPEFAGIPRNISFLGDGGIQLSTVAFMVWVFILIAGASNAVNLTDGLDGLAAGSAAMVYAAFTVIAFWQFRNSGDYLAAPDAALDIAVISSAALAACAGFLWWNAPPAKIFMGDTGSLALGGLMAVLAMATNTQFLLALLGGLYVLETLSVIAQVFAFRVFGRRVLRMAPAHHHFELLGWQETTILVRFWIIGGIGVALGLGLFYAEWLNRVGTVG